MIKPEPLPGNRWPPNFFFPIHDAGSRTERESENRNSSATDAVVATVSFRGIYSPEKRITD